MADPYQRSASIADRAPGEVGVLQAAGCAIRWVSWGEHGPTVVLVHGARAHADWWNAVAGNLVEAGRRVVALDLSGHGDSGRRAHYSAELWADEVAEVIAEKAGGYATVVGHSMGGWVSIACAARRPEQVRAVVLLDCAVRRPREDAEWEPRGMRERPLRRYRSRQEAVESFRLVPPQPASPELLRAVAEASVRQAADGSWTWKFDPAMAQSFSDGLIRDHLHRVRCPLHLVYGTEDPIVSAATAEQIGAMLGRPVPATPIEGAYHHALLDHPEEVAAALLGTGLLDSSLPA
jgi:pimeloyl-ACP methyl ester carboxylesterase